MTIRFDRGSSRRAGVRAGALLLAAGLAMASCSSSSTGKGIATSTTVSSLPPSGSPSAGTDLQTELQHLGVQPSDAPGYFVHLYAHGDQVAGQVTLDLCAGIFPSEALRVGRYQVGVAQSEQSRLLFSTEAVAYGDAAGPSQAFSELSQVAARCPNGFVQGRIAGEPPLKTVFAPKPDQGWPSVAGVDRLAFEATVSDRQGQSQRTVGVYLRRGRFLLAVYFDDPAHPPTVAGQNALEGIVNVFAERLASVSLTAT